MRDSIKPWVNAAWQTFVGALLGFAISQVALGTKVAVNVDQTGTLKSRVSSVETEISELRRAETAHMAEATSLWKEQLSTTRDFVRTMKEQNDKQFAFMEKEMGVLQEFAKLIKQQLGGSSPN